MEPVVDVNLLGRFAFVEFRTPDMATASTHISQQIMLNRQWISVERPQDYVQVYQNNNFATQANRSWNAAALPLSPTVTKICVCNINPSNVSDTQLRTLFNGHLEASFPGSDVPGMEAVTHISMDNQKKCNP
eukprot:gene11046-18651_t